MQRWILVLMLVALSTSAFAKGKTTAPASQAQLKEVLGDISWGDSKADVVNKIKKREMDRLREDKKISSDALLMQKERKDLIDRLAVAEKSYTRLEGDTGYDVSVIGDEYSSNNGE